jgi:hypothetical protein
MRDGGLGARVCIHGRRGCEQRCKAMKSTRSWRWRRSMRAIRLAAAGGIGDVRGISNPQAEETSMLLGDRRGDTPKTEGGGGRSIDPLRAYVVFLFVTCAGSGET